MYLFSRQFINDIEKRIAGPGSFRFIVQPLVAIALGIRDGLNDAKTGEPPYLIGILFSRDHRRELLISGIKDIIKPFIVGVVLDLILQLLIFKTIHPGAGMVVGFFLIGLPYSLSRGITNRIARRRYRGRRAQAPEKEGE